jgi:hypothetical protein
VILVAVAANLVMQWVGMAIIVAGLTAVFGWPWGLVITGLFLFVVGVTGEITVRGSGVDDTGADDAG